MGVRRSAAPSTLRAMAEGIDRWGRHYPTVLHVIGGLWIGGIERQLVGFITRSTSPELHHVASSSPDPQALDDEVPNPPLRFGRVAAARGGADRIRPLALALRATVRDVRPDVVHAYQPTNRTIAELGTPLGIPIVASLRGFGDEQRRSARLRIAAAVANARTRVLICNSTDLARQARTRRLHARAVEVIPNGVDTDRFAVALFPVGPPTVAVVANLFPYKRLQRLVRATALLVRELPLVRVTFVGGGVERGRLEQLVDDLGLREAVSFAGQVDDPRPFVAGSHVVALASEHEGFPNALLEAMSMGRPVVATRVGGVPELVRDGRDGFLTSADPAEIADRLLRILSDDTLRDRMGASARARAETFTWERVVRSTEAVYAKVLRRR
jgi:glycosyltransferase involved in cell wall biosynthesis